MESSSYPHLTSAIAMNPTFIDEKGTEAAILQADKGKNNKAAFFESGLSCVDEFGKTILHLASE